jgi:hypothetical protein
MSLGCYRFVVEGELGPRYLSAFGGMEIRPDNGKTEIIGPITDQSHLQAILERIGSLGLTLKSVVSLENNGRSRARAPGDVG